MTYDTPESICLNCGCRVAAATDSSPDGFPIRRPADGDISVCWKCGAVTKFRADGTLRGMTQEEMDELAADREFMNHIAKLVARIQFIRAQRN